MAPVCSNADESEIKDDQFSPSWSQKQAWLGLLHEAPSSEYLFDLRLSVSAVFDKISGGLAWLRRRGAP